MKAVSAAAMAAIMTRAQPRLIIETHFVLIEDHPTTSKVILYGTEESPN